MNKAFVGIIFSQWDIYKKQKGLTYSCSMTQSKSLVIIMYRLLTLACSLYIDKKREKEKKNTVVVRLSLFELTMLLKEEDLPRFDRYVTACSINRLAFSPLDRRYR
jgi:accessory gene regulator protein AgrB